MPILQSVNAKYNYLPEDILRYIAEELHIPLSDVYSIATFYNAFSLVPRGRHKIQVCLGTSCYVRGGTGILEAFERKLGVAAGETTEDLKFSLETVRCIGCCSLAPAIRIDTDAYARLRSDKVGGVLSEYD